MATTALTTEESGKQIEARASDAEIDALLEQSLYRLTEGIPQQELRLMVTEAKASEEALKQEIKQLEEGLSNEQPKESTKKSPVDIMLESEFTPPDRYFTVSALLGRLRDDLATPLPPNSTLPALRAQHGLLQQPQKKKKATPSENPPLENPLSDLEKQKRLLALDQNPEYRREHEGPTALLNLWKKISTHRTSVVFRRPVNPKEAPGYTDRIPFPMDLSLIRKMIVARMIKTYAELHQRIGLICHNCVKYNGRYAGARQSSFILFTTGCVSYLHDWKTQRKRLRACN